MTLDQPDHGWLRDLVDPDKQVRSRALARQEAHVAAAGRALDWSNQVWARAGAPAPKHPPDLAAEWGQAQAAFSWHQRRSFTGPISEFLRTESGTTPNLESASFALLYLRWEACYPQDWRAPESNLWSPWSTKEHILRRFGRAGVPDTLRAEALDLLLNAIARPYRCKDWQYVRLVDHVQDRTFRDRVSTLADATDSLVAARARFVLHVADHPGRPLNRRSWQHWLVN